MTDEAEVGSFRHHELEVESLIHVRASNIKEKLCYSGWNESYLHSIYKIPASIRDIEPKAFQPQIVSIGPYHRGEEHLQAMEKHKWRILKRQLENPQIQLEKLVTAMTELEEVTRASYDQLGHHHDSSESFTEMMLLDGCFILEILDVSANGNRKCGYSLTDPVFNWRRALPAILVDLLMLENQLPMCVITELFPLLDKGSRGSVNELAQKCYRSIFPWLEFQYPSGGHERSHLLNLIWRMLAPPLNPLVEPFDNKNITYQKIRVHSVTRLRESGIKFVKREEGKRLNDIEFARGELHIPQLEINDFTKPFFLNLMAFEQCFPWCSNQITPYMSFMDCLIDSSKDVAHLREKGIIYHTLGSDDEVAHLFNNCCKEMSYDRCDPRLAKVSVQVNEHFDKKWNRWRATLKQDYLKNPWVITSLFAASFLLLLTLAQTTYSIISYHHPRS